MMVTTGKEGALIGLAQCAPPKAAQAIFDPFAGD